MYITQAGTIAWAQPAGAAGSTEGTPTTEAPAGDPGTGQPPGPAGPCGGMGSGTSIIMMVVMVAVFYFLLIRPQQKKAKEHQKMLDSIKKGDEVVTNGGLIGRVTGVGQGTLTIEISEKVRVRVVRGQVSGLHGAGVQEKK